MKINWSKNEDKNCRIIRSILTTFKSSFIFVLIGAAICATLDMMIPVVLKRIIDLIVDFKEYGPNGFRDGCIYLGIICISQLVSSITNSQSNFMQNVISQLIVVGISGMIYEKLFVRSKAENKQISTGEITNIAQTDTRNISLPFMFAFRLEGVIFRVILAIVLLFNFLGPVAAIPVALSFLAMLINFFTGRKMMQGIVGALKTKDARLMYTAEILNNLKYIKMNAWVDKYEENIAAHRKEEMKSRGKVYFFSTFNLIFFYLFPQIVTISTFVSYAFIIGPITMGTVFAVINLLTMLQIPLRAIPGFIAQAIEGYISSKRIEVFLQSKDTDLSSIERTNNSHSNHSIEVSDTSFAWGKQDKIEIKSESKKEEKKNIEDKKIEELKLPLLEEKKNDGVDLNANIILKHIDFKIKKGELIFLIGETASGKSSLFSALNGEMIAIAHNSNENKSIKINGKIAYVEQTPWIQSMTIQDNILFCSDKDEAKLHETVKICQLSSDLEVLPGGLLAEIGERGINLSGGQKMRVSLARALYSDSDIYFLDDPLSALDAHVKRKVMDECICGKLKGKTIIMATHCIEYLDKADKIIILHEGKIAFFDSYEKLKETPEFFSSISKLVETEDKMKLAKSTANSIKDKPESSAHSKLISQEEEKIGAVSWTVYRKYIEMLGGTFIIFVFLFVIIGWTFFSSFSDIFIGLWAKNSDNPNNSFTYLVYFICFGLISVIFIAIRLIAILYNSVKASEWLHNKMIGRVLRAPINLFHDKTPVGRLLNRFSNDLMSFDMEIPYSFSNSIIYTSRLLSIVIICSVFIFWSMFLFPFIILGGLYYLIFYLNMQRQLKRIQFKSKSPIIQFIQETHQGTSTIKMFNELTPFYNKFSNLNDLFSQYSIHSQGATCFLDTRISMISCLTNGMIILFALIKVTYWQEALVGLALSYGLSLQGYFSDFLWSLGILETGMVSLERCLEFTTIMNEAPQKLDSDRTDWPNQGLIEFRNYSVRYREDTPVILKKINIVFKGGEKIGIVGRTGSGKSTICLSLLRILEAFEGQIFIDGVDINQVGLDTLRSGMTIIPQDPTLFVGSLRNNIDPLKAYQDEEIMDALTKTKLVNTIKAEGNILEFKVQESGKNVSAGERQLICVARALLRRSKILLLDEATSAMDIQTEEIVREIMNNYFKESTIITIAHRIHTILTSDKVLVMNDGIVAEFGSPLDLQKNEKSLFKALLDESMIKN